jgi:hypothetical protein
MLAMTHPESRHPSIEFSGTVQELAHTLGMRLDEVAGSIPGLIERGYPTLADRLWPVQKAIAISSGRFCMLVNRDDDHLNMLAVSQAGDTRQSRTCRPRKRMWSGLLPVTIDRLPLSPGSRRCHSVLVPSFGHRIGESALVLGCEHLGMKRRRCSGHYGGSGHQPADNPAEFVESDPMPTPLRGGRLSSAKEPHEKPLRV